MSRESSDDEVEQLPSDEAFEKVEVRVREIQDILKRETLRVRKEKEAFDSVAKKLKHVHFSSTVKLNVGGQIFTTSLQTLTKDAGSMLHAMFSGRFDTKPAEDGSYFIDRDGTCFRYILNYLRTGELFLPDDRLVQKEVLAEAKFYQIQGIVDELDPKHYVDSVILSPDQAKWLEAVHGKDKKFSKCSILYRATRDGWSSSNFHSKCDSFNGPTMVVIKSTGGYIFGGYTEQSWSVILQGDFNARTGEIQGFIDDEDSGGTYKSDSTAFLFSLVNPVGTPPVQMKVFRSPQNAIYCNNDYGPTFGGNHDLLIRNHPQSNECNVNIGHTYALPSGQSATNFLSGGQYFKVAEMEVYGFENY